MSGRTLASGRTSVRSEARTTDRSALRKSKNDRAFTSIPFRALKLGALRALRGDLRLKRQARCTSKQAFARKPQAAGKPTSLAGHNRTTDRFAIEKDVVV